MFLRSLAVLGALVAFATVAQADGQYGINVLSASWGRNCGSGEDVTSMVSQHCSVNSNCNYYVNAGVLGDPYPGCDKEFRAEYRCGQNGRTYYVGGRNLQTVQLYCGRAENDSFIHVTNVNYGANLPDGMKRDAEKINRRALDHASNACRGRTCDYYVDVANFGDPAPGVDKGIVINYECVVRGPTVLGTRIAELAKAHGQRIRLSCED